MVRSMLSESLQAVISQTLMKKIGGGRVAAHEIMIGTAAIRNLIREDKVAQMYSAIQTGGAPGHADPGSMLCITWSTSGLSALKLPKKKLNYRTVSRGYKPWPRNFRKINQIMVEKKGLRFILNSGSAPLH